ncbi:hypothetical protein F4802DRAFT_434415 [Xylaria palmicola]|nr:hypothetical protein F4802DRAFT_434415 [Xylaria palmicola]
MPFPTSPRAAALLMLSQLAVIAAAAASSTARSGAAVISHSYDYASLACPPSSAPSTLLTPTYGDQGAVFTVCSSLSIAAPAALVRDAVLDFRAYGRWNSFVVSVSLPPDVAETPRDLYEGMPMVFTTAGLVGGLNTTSDEVLTILDGRGVGADGKPYLLVAWRYDDKMGGLGARAEHPVIVVDQGDGSSWYLSYETYYVGLTTPAIALLKTKLLLQFDAQSADLKAYVEGLLR